MTGPHADDVRDIAAWMSDDQPEFSPKYLPVAVAAMPRDDFGIALPPRH